MGERGGGNLFRNCEVCKLYIFSFDKYGNGMSIYVIKRAQRMICYWEMRPRRDLLLRNAAKTKRSATGKCGQEKIRYWEMLPRSIKKFSKNKSFILEFLIYYSQLVKPKDLLLRNAAKKRSAIEKWGQKKSGIEKCGQEKICYWEMRLLMISEAKKRSAIKKCGQGKVCF